VNVPLERSGEGIITSRPLPVRQPYCPGSDKGIIMTLHPFEDSLTSISENVPASADEARRHAISPVDVDAPWFDGGVDARSHCGDGGW